MTGVPKTYQRAREYLAHVYRGKSRLERFWNRINVRGEDDCWLWTGALSKMGYGRTNSPYNSGTVGAHRLMWILDRKSYPVEALVIAHKCHVRNCVNPRHLECVTQGKNMADAVALGSFKGVNHGRARLTEQDVYTIRGSHLSENQLSREYGVSPSHIHRIRTRECWTHLPELPQYK